MTMTTLNRAVMVTAWRFFRFLADVHETSTNKTQSKESTVKNEHKIETTDDNNNNSNNDNKLFEPTNKATNKWWVSHRMSLCG
jgi:hypothetical protein